MVQGTHFYGDAGEFDGRRGISTQFLSSLNLPIGALLCTERDCVKRNCDLDCYYMDIVCCLNTASVSAVPPVSYTHLTLPTKRIV